MAGVKGRSGGARSGAGRKPDLVEKTEKKDPLEVLLSMMNDPEVPVAQRINAAKAAAPYVHKRLGDEGKKEERSNAAKDAAKGKFAPKAPPKLIVNNR